MQITRIKLWRCRTLTEVLVIRDVMNEIINNTRFADAIDIEYNVPYIQMYYRRPTPQKLL